MYTDKDFELAYEYYEYECGYIYADEISAY